MEKHRQTVRKVILKTSSDPESVFRKWYNDCVLKLPDKKVLDIGKSIHWDYSGLFTDYTTLDNNSDVNPTVVADITKSGLPDESFDIVLCNGMYEQVEGAVLVSEVKRILKKEGIAVFGFCGLDATWEGNKYDGQDLFEGFVLVGGKDFDKKYHFIICQKLS